MVFLILWEYYEFILFLNLVEYEEHSYISSSTNCFRSLITRKLCIYEWKSTKVSSIATSLNSLNVIELQVLTGFTSDTRDIATRVHCDYIKFVYQYKRSESARAARPHSEQWRMK